MHHLDPVGNDFTKAEEILMSNLLFHPRTRTEDGCTVEFVCLALFILPL
jgi:hypothetical protein